MLEIISVDLYIEIILSSKRKYIGGKNMEYKAPEIEEVDKEIASGTYYIGYIAHP